MKKRIPSPEELWTRSERAGSERARVYLRSLHEWGYFSWPLYNVEPSG